MQRHPSVRVSRYVRPDGERRHGKTYVRDGLERFQPFACSMDAPDKSLLTQAGHKAEHGRKPSKQVHDSMIACGPESRLPETHLDRLPRPATNPLYSDQANRSVPSRHKGIHESPRRSAETGKQPDPPKETQVQT